MLEVRNDTTLLEREELTEKEKEKMRSLVKKEKVLEK